MHVSLSKMAQSVIYKLYHVTHQQMLNPKPSPDFALVGLMQCTGPDQV